MNKLLFCGCIILLTGCVYEQSPAPINDVSIVEEKPVQVQQPTSMSYPLPSAPQINNIIINEPQPLPNPVPDKNYQNEEIVIDNTPISEDSANRENVISQTNEASDTKVKTENINDIVDSIINKPTSNNQSAMGTFNNPVRFDQSKVYK